MEAGDSTNPEDKSGQNSEPEGREVITSGLVHDFNNVLSIILGNSELALLDIDQSSPAHHHVKEINTACLRIEEILKRLRKQTR